MSRARLGDAPVDAVLVDYGMTLVTFARPQAALLGAYERIATLVASRLGVAVPDGAALLTAVHDRVEQVVAEHEARHGHVEIDVQTAHARAWSDLGLRLPADVLDEAQRLEQRAWLEGVRVTPSAPAVLDRLRDGGVLVAICSNAPYRAASMLEQLDHLGLRAHVDTAVFSVEAGWRKPSPRLFTAALDALGGVPPGRAVMVGDRVAEDVDGAHAAGLRAVLCREHRAEPDPEGHADATVERLVDLPALLGL